MVFYTNWFIPSRFAAMTYGPFIFIRPEKKDDAGLLAHEQTHVRQFKRNPFFGLAYWLSKKKRLDYEVEAYREQLKHSRDKADAFALALSTKYGLTITKDEAFVRLLDG
jgi:hypothetical protein